MKVSVSGQAFCGAQLDNMGMYAPRVEWQVIQRGKGESHVAEVTPDVAEFLANYLDLDPLGVDPELAPCYRAAQRASQKIRAALNKART